MARDGFRPAYHPAGHDAELRNALQDLRVGRWMAMRSLLAATDDPTVWTQRTQVLATASAGTDLVEAWRAEDARSVAACVMYARVLVERALRAHREGHERTGDLWQRAWEACRVAAHTAADDPVPWVCLLALSQLDEDRRWEEHRLPPPEPMLPRGPWGLLAEADRRDPHNREAYHRMLQFMYAQQKGGRLSEAVNFAQWAAASAKPGSALHALPLYVRVERYRRQGGQQAALDLHWVAEDATREALRATQEWFDLAAPRGHSLLDLNYLAHALWGSLQFSEAARVFEAIGPYATPVPWAYRTPEPTASGPASELFIQARTRCLAALRGSRRT